MEKHESAPAELEEEAAEEADLTVGYNSLYRKKPQTNTPLSITCRFICAGKAWPPTMPGCGTALISTAL